MRVCSILLPFFFLLSSCGQTGPLYHPGGDRTPPPTNELVEEGEITEITDISSLYSDPSDEPPLNTPATTD